jgi:hypothetical protein
MNIKSVASTISPYIYAGAVRVGVTDVVSLLREQVLARIPTEQTARVAEFLRTPIGDGVLRLAIAGALASVPKDRDPDLLADVRLECFVSASSSGLTGLQELLLEGVDRVRRQLAAAKEGEQ